MEKIVEVESATQKELRGDLRALFQGAIRLKRSALPDLHQRQLRSHEGVQGSLFPVNHWKAFDSDAIPSKPPSPSATDERNCPGIVCGLSTRRRGTPNRIRTNIRMEGSQTTRPRRHPFDRESRHDPLRVGR